MVLAFDNAGSFAKAVYGDSHHAGANGAIAMRNPSMTGGRRNSRRNNNKSRKNRNNNKSRKNKRNSRRQNGGK